LIVPGPRAEASVGIAIGHMHAPLQGLVRAAQAAERRAKGPLGRGAFAVTVFKRSGETAEWGAKWTSGALELYREFMARTLGGEVSGKFAYALDELIRPYRKTGSLETVADFDIKKVIPLELDRVLDRQIDLPDKKSVADALRESALAYLDKLDKDRAAEDFPMLFKIVAFIQRGERE
jgi:hypothetical protein